MNKQTISNIKLGIFVIAGLLFLILLLYMIGRTENLFGSTFRLRAHFGNVQGLTAGNNVRYAGIQVGTVRKVSILNDTLIEVVMLIETDMKKIIRKNAVVAIGTDGLMGNRVLNISPSPSPALPVEENDILPVKGTVEIDEMLQTLARTNDDVAIIATQLKKTVIRINESSAIWEIANDKSLPQHLRHSLRNISTATAKADHWISDLQSILDDIKQGKGTLGAVLTDSSLAISLRQAVDKLQQVGDDADSLAVSIKSLVNNIRTDIDGRKGTIHTLLRDTLLAKNIQESIQQIQQGTESFNEVMEALKHNFLFRGYFRRLEKQKRSEQQK